MKKLERSIDCFCRIKIKKSNNITYSYHKVVSSILDVCANILQCEKMGLSRDEILEIVEPARQIHWRSPFIKRLQEWPRGYPGDFETLEYLFTAENKAEKNTVEYFCEDFALHSPPAQQHRNKTLFHSQLILDIVLNHSGNGNSGHREPKILLISSGNSRGVTVISDCLKHLPCRLYLNDADEEALEFSKKNLSALNDRCQYIKGYFSVSIKSLMENGPYDLVIIGGLFDYLKDKHIRKIVKNVYNDMLNKNGLLYFTNIGKYNPYRPWIEYLANWILIERSRYDIRKLLNETGISDYQLDIKMEDTGLTHLVTLKKLG
ncbi:MAG: class I SAM-dependent methyltransferase [Spirochaetales bacterium]|nr:class I SAM-dependent methyltransferase [Spirochaetales bacterium]